MGDAANGIKTLASGRGVVETLDRLESLAKSRGMTIFARIHFSDDAARVGLTLLPSELLILGNPKGGTPLMVAAPTSALDLPLKVLAWQDEQGRCWVSYNTPEYLQARHEFPASLMNNIAALGALVDAAVAAA